MATSKENRSIVRAGGRFGLFLSSLVYCGMMIWAAYLLKAYQHEKSEMNTFRSSECNTTQISMNIITNQMEISFYSETPSYCQWNNILVSNDLNPTTKLWYCVVKIQMENQTLTNCDILPRVQWPNMKTGLAIIIIIFVVFNLLELALLCFCISKEREFRKEEAEEKRLEQLSYLETQTV